MQNKWRKILAAVLCLTMVLALMPTASADFDTYNETPEDHQAPQPVEIDERDAWERSDVDAEPGDKTYDWSKAEADPEKEPDVETVSVKDSALQDVRKAKEDSDFILLEGKADGKKDVEKEEGTKSNVYSGTMQLGSNWYEINAGDTTFMSFTPSEDGTYRFYTLVEGDTYGYLQDADKNQITENDDDGYGFNFDIWYEMEAGTTYYIGARFWGNGTTGSFYVYAERFQGYYSTSYGTHYAYIDVAGTTIYYAFCPEVSGTYRIYSVSNSDTYLTVTNSYGQVFSRDDDSGYGSNFQGDYYFEAGEYYGIGVRFLDNTLTDSIPFMIERQVISGESLILGLNSVTIDEEEMTVYRPFTAPMEGWYWIYSAAPYDRNTAYVNLFDTYGTVANDGMQVYAYNDDGGHHYFHKFEMFLEAGETVYFGTRFYSAYAGNIPLLIEYPYVVGNDLYLGGNTVSVDYAGGTIYDVFTPEETATYRIFTEGDYDTFGTLRVMDDEYATYGIVLFDDDTGPDGNFRFDYLMEAGKTYYIGYRFVDPSQTGEFTLHILKTIPFDGTIEWNKSDLQFKGATPYVVYNGSAFTPRFTVKKADGSVMDPSEYTYSYAENVNAGTGYVVVEFNEHYSAARQWFKIYLPATTWTKVENTDGGVKISWTPVTGADGYVIYRRAWSSTTGGWTTFERWNNTRGSNNWTDTTVYAGSRYQYGVKAYFDQRYDPISGAWIGGNVGDNYNLGLVGPLKTTVRITTRTLKSLKAGSGKITATWEGSNKFTGYQLRCATDANFTKNVKTVTINKPKTTSKDLTSLKNGTLYYVQVRSYHVFEGTTYYGGWSNTLSVKPGSGQTVTQTRYRALCIGQNAYEYANPLNGCVNDMKALSATLKTLKTKFTTTEKANQTADQIIAAIRTIANSSSANDVTVFSYSGHGASSGALCGVDCYGSSGLVSTSQLATELSKIKGRVIVLLDSCHSGAAIGKGEEDALESFNRNVIEALSGYNMNGEKTGELANSKFIVITAAHSSQYSYDGYYDGSGYPQGAFTAALIMGIGGSYPSGAFIGGMPADVNDNGSVTLKELFDYTYAVAYMWTESQQAQYYGPDNTVLFSR